MRIAISGASGLLGTALTEHLAADHELIRLVRRPGASMLERRWDPVAGFVEGLGLSDVDAVINLSGAGIADRRWTMQRRRELLSSRVEPSRTLARLISAEERPSIYLSASAVGYYGSTGDRPIDETTPNGTGFLADLCRQWEAAAQGAGVRTVNLRTGLPLTTEGGFLGKLLPLYRAGLGGRMGDGRQWIPWISLSDWLGAIAHLLTTEVSGPVNLSAPHPVTQAELTRELGHKLHRPTALATPLTPLRIAFGSDLVDEALLASNRMLPKVLRDSGFQFRHPRLGDALDAILTR